MIKRIIAIVLLFFITIFPLIIVISNTLIKGQTLEIESIKIEDMYTLDNTMIYEELSIKEVEIESKQTAYYTELDLDMYYIQCCVETETYGADIESKKNVASVIINRVNAGFGSTITEVVTAPNQFSYFRTTISDTTVQAINEVLTNGDTTNGALFFHSNDRVDTFNEAQYIFTDSAGHHFYK